jgi:hypothetical protein
LVCRRRRPTIGRRPHSTDYQSSAPRPGALAYFQVSPHPRVRVWSSQLAALEAKLEDETLLTLA